MTPTSDFIKYRDLSGYKYILSEPAVCDTKIKLDVHVILDPWIRMEESGVLVLSEGYAWDGPSGPAIDTKTFLRASLFHDAGYQLIRAGKLGSKFRSEFDSLMRTIARKDGMSWFRGWYTWAGVRIGAGWAANPKRREDQDVILKAP